MENQARREFKMEYYKELRLYFTANQKNKFILYLLSSYRKDNYIKVLELEERYDELLNFVRKEKNDFDLDVYIRPILNIYPSECYQILTERVQRDLNSTGRNRNTYQIMVKMMKLLPLIKGKEKDAEAYFLIIYANRLPALKDEMVKAKLVKK